MAIRELVTAFTFQTEMAGLREYEGAVEKAGKATEKAFDPAKISAGFEKLSGVVFKLTNLLGLTFAIGAMDKLAEKAMDYTKEIINGAKETNRLNAQIGMIVGNTREAAEVQETLYNLAQKTGMEYTDVAEMSKGILVASKEQKIPFEESTAAISNMVLALKVGKASAQETAEAVGSLEMGLRMGKIGPRTIGRLIQAPGLGQFLADQLTGGDLNKLRAEAGKKGFEIKKLIEGMAKPNENLNQSVEKLPFTIARAFAMIKNDMTEAAAAIMKLTKGFGGLGKIIWGAFSFAKSATLGFIDALGGLQNTVELVGYALAVALGPLLIRNLIVATASLIEMAVASWAVWAPWVAIGLAVVGVALALQDMMMWMKGGNSKTVFGDLLGPFDEFKKKIEDFPIVKIFEGITDFLKGDFGAGFKSIEQGFANIKTPADALWTTVEFIGGAFITWEVLQFTGIIGALGKLAAAFLPVKAAAVETTTAIQRAENAANAPGAPAGGPGSPAGPGPRTGRTPIKKAMIGAGIALPFVIDATVAAQEAGLVPKGSQGFQDRLQMAGTGSTLGTAIGAAIGAMFFGAGAAPGAAVGGGIGAGVGFIFPEVKETASLLAQAASYLGNAISKTGITLQNTNPSAEAPGVPSSGQMPATLPPISLPSWLGFGSTNPSAEQPPPLIIPPSGPPPIVTLSPDSVVKIDPQGGAAPGAQAPPTSPEQHPIIMPWTSSSITPQVSPFATSGPQTVANTVNAGGIVQNNTINVTAQMDEAQVAAAVQKTVSAQAPDLLDRMSRQIQDSMPRSERATG